MLCHTGALPWHVVLCYVTLCHAVLYRAVLAPPTSLVKMAFIKLSSLLGTSVFAAGQLSLRAYHLQFVTKWLEQNSGDIVVVCMPCTGCCADAPVSQCIHL